MRSAGRTPRIDEEALNDVIRSVHSVFASLLPDVFAEVVEFGVPERHTRFSVCGQSRADICNSLVGGNDRTCLSPATRLLVCLKERSR